MLMLLKKRLLKRNLFWLISIFFVITLLTRAFHDIHHLSAIRDIFRDVSFYRKEMFTGEEGRFYHVAEYSANYTQYPGSISFLELCELQLVREEQCPSSSSDDISDRYGLKYNQSQESRLNKTRGGAILEYSEKMFRSAKYPVLWLDTVGDVHWNEAAEQQMYSFLTEKQFPKEPVQAQTMRPDDRINTYIRDCYTRPLIVLQQRGYGLISRVHTFIEQFGQSLYNPAMAVLSPHGSSVEDHQKDFQNEGILAYYAPISRCSSYIKHFAMNTLKSDIARIVENRNNPKAGGFVNANSFKKLREFPYTSFWGKDRFLYMGEFWNFSYEHVPHRKWLFDVDQESARSRDLYSSTVGELIDHSVEHIYCAPNRSFDLDTWEPRNSPYKQPLRYLDDAYRRTWKDKVFMGFLRYLFTLFFYQLAPRLQLGTQMLHYYWRTYVSEKKNLAIDNALSSVAAVVIRRGDHAPEDDFFRKYGYWRNISLYMKGLREEEIRRKRLFDAIFIMSDDVNVIQAIREYSDFTRDGLDEIYARQFLKNRTILTNVYAPENCRQPYSRLDFEQFFISVNFVIKCTTHLVQQRDSNIGRYLEEVVYGRRQLQRGVHSYTYVRSAPDEL
jgi:hypothetical protein